MKPFRIDERELSWLTDEQVGILLDAIRRHSDNPHVEPVTLLCLATGARWSEAEGLTPSGVRNGALTYSKTKSSRVRTVPIGEELERFIRDHWKRHGPFTGSISSFRRALVRSGIDLPKGRPAMHCATPSPVTSYRRAGTFSRCRRSWGTQAWP